MLCVSKVCCAPCMMGVRLTIEVSEQLMEHFGDQVYHTVIPRNIVAEAPSHGEPVL